ncbi:MAG: hypothetical protein VST67_11695 [Nitrospirota bacterium]|nr:hypothetical protein [Nitrospirota bacterium]
MGVLISPAAALIFVLGVLVALWVGATAGAPIHQRNELRNYLKSFQVEQRIQGGWRSKDGKAEFILTNHGSKSINGVSVTLRNYQKADGTPGGDIMYDMPTTDGRKPPLELYPGDPTYFHFAGLGKTNGNTIIILLPHTDRALQVGTEVGVKLGFRGTDLTAQPINLRLKVSDGGLSVESWDEGKKAVGEGGIEA